MLVKFSCYFVPISIHPPREGWDAAAIPGRLLLLVFQSTHPVRGGTVLVKFFCYFVSISIHPPREGWDFAACDATS